MPTVSWDVVLADETHRIRLAEWEVFVVRRNVSVDGMPVALTSVPSEGLATQRLDFAHGGRRFVIAIAIAEAQAAYRYELSVDGHAPIPGHPLTIRSGAAVLLGIALASVAIALTLLFSSERFALVPFVMLAAGMLVVIPTGFWLLARNRAARFAAAAAVMEPASGTNPVCPKCGTVYNRAVVLRQLRTQSPEMFDFANWTTKFRCIECAAEIPISA